MYISNLFTYLYEGVSSRLDFHVYVMMDDLRHVHRLCLFLCWYFNGVSVMCGVGM